MHGDKLVFNLYERALALDTTDIFAVVEAKKVFFIPGQRGFVKGVISFRGNPVTVVDLKRVFNLPSKNRGPSRIIIAGRATRAIGLDVGKASISFLWDEDLKSTKSLQKKGRYIYDVIEYRNRPIYLLNWYAIFEETVKILSGSTTT